MPPMPCTEFASLDADALAALGELAARVIRHELAVASDVPSLAHDARFAAHGASFVTLKRSGRLRGCIGTLEAWRALHVDVAANALAATLRDPRFAPLSKRELVDTEVEVSVLSAPMPMQFADESDFYRQLRPGIDGLIVEHQGRRATYLPSVWEQLQDARLFVTELRRKAGIDASVALTALRVQRYTSQHSAPRALSGA